LGIDPEEDHMQVVQAHATFVTPETIDESLTTIVARSVLEAALQEDDSAELWFELGNEDSENVSRLSIELSHTDIEQLLGLSSEDEIALSLDGEAVESLFGDADVEAHGLKGAIAIAVTSAAILAPAGQAALPQSVGTAATQQAKIQATTQVGTAATTQVSSIAAKTQVSSLQAKAQVKSQVAKLSGFKLLRSGLAR
jgi:hypothetical protein